ncbi:hypothetical protein OG244_15760 [Streptomyces brevispora]|uniref:hypothetical protein n=1 Tax=Streptomyces brevispora TaxID=887462 RepID=UPI002E32F521|nr:hypothetical protein [Streptomyces brevispora]
MKTLPKSRRKSKTPAAAAISKRLEETIESAEYWARRMPREAVRLVRKERLYGIVAGGISLSTGFLVWPMVAGSSALTVQVLVSGLSGLAALAIAAPYASGLSDRGEDAIKLGGVYGAAHRELTYARERGGVGSAKNASQLSEVLQQFDFIEERRDSLGIPARPRMVSMSDLAMIQGVEEREGAIPIEPRKRPRKPASAVAAESGRTVVVDQDAVATLIYLLATQLASNDQNAPAGFADRPFAYQPEIWEQGSAGRLEPDSQLPLPFELSRGSESEGRDEERLTATPNRRLSKLSGPAGPLRRFSRS